MLFQGYLPVEALVSDVEAWALGGKAAKEVQEAYKKREELFTDQRRKVKFKKSIRSIMQMHKRTCKFDKL